MSEASKAARSAMKGKISRLMRTDPKAKVDASGYTPPDALDADVQTGARPVRGRRYKRGGKVMKVEGEHAKHHAGRKPRKSGGSAYATPDNLLNRDVVEANKERAGSKHVGAFKKGGKVHHKAAGGPMMPGGPSALDTTERNFAPARKHGGKAMKHDDAAEDKKLIKKVVKKDALKPGMAHKSSGGSNLGPHPEFDKLSDAGIKEAHSYWHARKSQADSDNVKHPEAERNLSLLQEEKKNRGMKHGGEIHASNCRCAKCMGGRMGKDSGGSTPPQNPPQNPKTDSDLEADSERMWSNMAHPQKPKKKGGSVSDGTLEGTRPTGGRLARKRGGHAMNKGPTIIKIDVGAHPHGMMGGMPPGMPPRPAGAVPVPVTPPGMMMPPGAPPPMGGGAPPMMPPGGARPSMPPPGLMGRKSGGRVHKYPITDGSGGGMGRLEKIKAYGLKPA